MNKRDLIVEQVIGGALEVHRHLGPGLLESVYESCLEYELTLQGMKIQRQLGIPIKYKNFVLEQEFCIDILVEDQIIIEIKSVHEINSIHKAQLMTYLRLRGGGLGLLINFNVSLLKQGISRIII